MIVNVHVRELVFPVQCADGHQPVRWLGFIACQRYGLEKGHLHQQQFLPQAVKNHEDVVIDPSREIRDFFNDNSDVFIDISGGTKSYTAKWNGRIETPPVRFDRLIDDEELPEKGERPPGFVDMSWLKKFDFKKYGIDKLLLGDLKKMAEPDLEVLAKSFSGTTAATGGELLKATRDFNGSRPEHLTIKKGDMVKVIENSDASWWKGQLGDKIGFFPAGSLEMEQVVACREFTGTKAEELNFQKGDILTLLDRSDHNWWRGQHFTRIGIFPRTFVTLIPRGESGDLESGTKVLALKDSGNVSSDELAYSKNEIINVIDMSKPDKWKGAANGNIGYFNPANTCMLQDAGIGAAKARRDFSASKTGELPFKRGERVVILEKTNPELWKGMLHGKVGFFPSSHVDMEQYVAVEQHEATRSDEVGFSSHAVINVIDKTDPNRWKGEVNGKVGFFSARSVTRAEQYPSNKDYRAARGEELSVRKGDMITILEKDNPDYYLANANGSVGYVPKALVTILDTPIEEPKTEVLSIRDYTAKDPDEISFTKFAHITILDRKDRDIWKGKVGDRVGYFPRNTVEAILSQKQGDGLGETGKGKKSSVRDDIVMAEFIGIRTLFTERAGFIRNLFSYYSSINHVGYNDVKSISSSQFMSFAKDCKLLTAQFKPADLDILFVASNAKPGFDFTGNAQQKRDSDRNMTILEFLAALIRLSFLRYKQMPKVTDRLRALFDNDIAPHAMHILHDLVKRFKPLHSPQVKAVADKLAPKFTRLFNSLIFEEKVQTNTVPFEKILQLSRQMDLFGSERMSIFHLRSIFMYATSISDDSADVVLDKYMPEANFEQFTMVRSIIHSIRLPMNGDLSLMMGDF
eukprot:TRINITY_DN11192_c0_g1_i7.p1 TRINITY_DN11192_c0_g1~~TRINITY_DN11192_c0_g1_i7.p1  ORF type:complete len:861 (-),score=201.47 TRINITY_DN11192_c0_g1_i7:2289-4871(-)